MAIRVAPLIPLSPELPNQRVESTIQALLERARIATGVAGRSWLSRDGALDPTDRREAVTGALVFISCMSSSFQHVLRLRRLIAAQMDADGGGVGVMIRDCPGQCYEVRWYCGSLRGNAEN